MKLRSSSLVSFALLCALLCLALPACSVQPPASTGPAFTADPGDDASAREMLDVAVLAALGGQGWTVLGRENRPDGARHYELHSLIDEPGTLTITPNDDGLSTGTWRGLNTDELRIEVSVGFLPKEPANLRRAERLAQGVRDRLRALERKGHAPIRGR